MAPQSPTPFYPPYLLRLPNDLVNRLGHILHVPLVQPRHADPPVLRHVHMRLIPQLPHLLLAQAREAKHADLIRDVLPTALLPVQLLQLRPQRLPHVLDAPAHGPQVRLPLREQRRVVEDRAGDARAVGRRVADFAALQDGELGRDAGDGVGGVRAGAGDEVEGAGAFAIEAEVLGEGLGDAHFEALGDEVADGPGVVFEVARSEALVGAVEEGEVVAGADDFAEFDPLVTGGVDAGGVVGAGV